MLGALSCFAGVLPAPTSLKCMLDYEILVFLTSIVILSQYFIVKCWELVLGAVLNKNFNNNNNNNNVDGSCWCLESKICCIYYINLLSWDFEV